ncbi:MAG: alpha/beta hydrolase [Caulobacter sp.]|nr:alpha/beta hydrolase [Caulobacter sp.]
MTGAIQTVGGVRLLVFPPHGPVAAGELDATDLIGEAFGADAGMVAIPLSRLSPDFLVLSTRIAGLILQKFINYGIRVAILGDITAAVDASDALRDFVRESNRGQWVWFAPDLAALEARLTDSAPGA